MSNMEKFLLFLVVIQGLRLFLELMLTYDNHKFIKYRMELDDERAEMEKQMYVSWMERNCKEGK